MIKYKISFLAFFTVTFLSASDVTPSTEGTRTETYRGKFIEIDEKGIVKFLPRKIPPFTGQQYATAPFRTVGPVYVQDGMPFRYVEMPGISIDSVAQLAGANHESVITDAPFELVTPQELEQLPYFACGRLEMYFYTPDSPLPKVFYGSASAIQPDLLITAAHNFLPDVFNGIRNVAKIKAGIVHFEHQLVEKQLKRIHASSVDTHCFLHPKWVEDFDQNFDIAFIFLTEPICLEQHDSPLLLKLSIEKNETPIEIVGYPHGHPTMTKTKGETRDCVDSSSIFYHSANTHPGHSGSPIVQNSGELIGVHTRGKDPVVGLNSGVKIRKDIMDFMDQCTQDYNNFLENKESVVEKIQKKEEEKKQALRDEGIVEGEKKGRLETARNLKGMGLSLDQISTATGLSLEDLASHGIT